MVDTCAGVDLGGDCDGFVFAVVVVADAQFVLPLLFVCTFGVLPPLLLLPPIAPTDDDDDDDAEDDDDDNVDVLAVVGIHVSVAVVIWVADSVAVVVCAVVLAVTVVRSLVRGICLRIAAG